MPRSRSDEKPKVRPLLVRRGARHGCAGDGLCCTDVHALGPVRDREAATLELISSKVLIRHRPSGSKVLQTGEDGACLFLGEGGCALHAALGPEGKPGSCRQFPFGLTATPRGGRITTEHLCPCRTMGERPDITPEQAEPCLHDAAGRVRADRRVGPLVPIASGQRVPFEEWERHEQTVLSPLIEGDGDPAEPLEAAPFPTLASGSWAELGRELAVSEELGLQARGRASRYEVALSWCGEALLALAEGGEVPRRDVRPWADSFDRAETRAADCQRTPRDVLADWVADRVWSMRWAVTGTFATARSELATQLALVRGLASTLEQGGARPDRAAAEALTVVELTGNCEDWRQAVRRIPTD